MPRIIGHRGGRMQHTRYYPFNTRWFRVLHNPHSTYLSYYFTLNTRYL